MKHYQQRDIEELGDFYLSHLEAMTKESLHGKSDIAAELAHRDMLIDKLNKELKRKNNG